MGIDCEKSFIMAERLKQLREEKGLSHEKLSKALFDQYNVKISSDSLMNYEVATANHSKAYKNQGMRVEYLRCLSDFYKVSADYLLGESDIRSPNPDVNSAVRLTGLSQESIQCLRNVTLWGVGREVDKVIDVLLFDFMYHNVDKQNKRSYRSVIDLLHFFFSYSNTTTQKQIFSNGFIADPGGDGYISVDAIALNDTIIENAVLMEIQQALVNLKRTSISTEEKHNGHH